MRAFALLLFLTCFSPGIYAQNILDSVIIKTVDIQAKIERQSSKQKIDSMALHGSQYANLGESLQQNANLYVKSYGIGSMASISLRGTNASQTKVLWNGISLNSAFNGIVDLSLFPTFFIDKAKVHYGLNSLQFGSGGLGGAVMMGNSANFAQKKELRFQQKIGSFGLKNSNLRLDLGNDKFKAVSRLFYKKTDNDFEYINTSKYTQPKEKVENAGLEQMGILQSFYYRLSESQLLSADVWIYHSDRQLPPLMNSRQFSERQIDASQRIMLRYTEYHNKGKLDLATALLKDEIDYRNERASSETLTKTLNWKNHLKWNREMTDKLSLAIRADANYSTLLPSNEIGGRIDRKKIAAMADLDYNFHPRWNLKGSFREEILIEEADFFLGYAEINFRPKISKHQLMLFLKAGKNLKYPSLNDLYWQPGGNPELSPELSQSAELGIQHQKTYLNGRFSSTLEANLYRSNVENYIQWQPTIYGYWKALNINKVAMQGIEARIKLSDNGSKLHKKLRANYTYSRSVKTQAGYQYDASVDQQLIYIPEHQFNAFAYLEYAGFYLKYNFQLMGARYITSDNSEYLPYYILSDFTFGKKVGLDKHQFQFSFSVLNAFDASYQAILNRPMPGRNFLFTLNYFLQP